MIARKWKMAPRASGWAAKAPTEELLLTSAGPRNNGLFTGLVHGSLSAISKELATVCRAARSNSRRWCFIAGSAAAALTFAAAPGEAANLARNGSFEKPVVPDGDLSRFGTGSTIGPWLVVGDGGNVDLLGDGWTYQGCSFPARKGRQQLDLTGSSNSAMGVQQVIKTTAGVTYELSMFVGSINSSCIAGNTSTVIVLVNGNQIASFVNTVVKERTTATWRKFSVEFQATGSRTTIALMNGDPESDTYNGIDGIMVKPAAP